MCRSCAPCQPGTWRKGCGKSSAGECVPCKWNIQRYNGRIRNSMQALCCVPERNVERLRRRKLEVKRTNIQLGWTRSVPACEMCAGYYRDCGKGSRGECVPAKTGRTKQSQLWSETRGLSRASLDSTGTGTAPQILVAASSAPQALLRHRRHCRQGAPRTQLARLNSLQRCVTMSLRPTQTGFFANYHMQRRRI